jgi:hypothetical protein
MITFYISNYRFGVVRLFRDVWLSTFTLSWSVWLSTYTISRNARFPLMQYLKMNWKKECSNIAPLKCRRFYSIVLPSDCGVPSQSGVNLSSADRWNGIGVGRSMEVECFKNCKQYGRSRFVCSADGEWKTDLKCGNCFWLFIIYIIIFVFLVACKSHGLIFCKFKIDEIRRISRRTCHDLILVMIKKNCEHSV